jgi:DNA-binding transcriptional regulator/RsmH inhibitor MraZ
MVKNLVAGSAELVQLDKQNRIKLSSQMLEACKIRQEVVVVGSMQYMQVFDMDAWKAMLRDGVGRMGKAIEAAAEKEKPKPRQIVKNYVISTAEIEKNAERQDL